MGILNLVKQAFAERQAQMMQDRARRDMSVNSSRTGFEPPAPINEEDRRSALAARRARRRS